MNTTMKNLAIPVTKTLFLMDISSVLMVINSKHKYNSVKLMTMQR